MGECEAKDPNAGDRAELMQLSDSFVNVWVHRLTGVSEEVQKQVVEHPQTKQSETEKSAGRRAGRSRVQSTGNTG